MYIQLFRIIAHYSPAVKVFFDEFREEIECIGLVNFRLPHPAGFAREHRAIQNHS
jgi:hypothetical protein